LPCSLLHDKSCVAPCQSNQAWDCVNVYTS
jgi:hypothetical protein